MAAKTVPETQGHFGSKTLCGISWNGAGALASLNGDADLRSMLLKCTLHDAQISWNLEMTAFAYVENGQTG